MSQPAAVAEPSPASRAESHSTTPPAARDAVFEVHAAEPAPAYPALIVRGTDHDRADGVLLRVRSIASRAELLTGLAHARPVLSVLPASAAARAIAHGLPARIVCAAVAPADYAPLDVEPMVGWSDPPTGVRRVAPRAVLVAPLVRIVAEPALVAAAIRAYWRGAEIGAQSPPVLAVMLGAEFGLTAPAAGREAARAIAQWRLEPAVNLPGLAAVLEALAARGEVPVRTRAVDLLDEQFVPAWRMPALDGRAGTHAGAARAGHAAQP